MGSIFFSAKGRKPLLMGADFLRCVRIHTQYFSGWYGVLNILLNVLCAETAVNYLSAAFGASVDNRVNPAAVVAHKPVLPFMFHQIYRAIQAL